MVDKDTILQVICGLMQHPQYLDEKDKYILSIDDFSSLFEKYVFSAIYNLHKDGAQLITVFDIDNYFNTHKTAKAVFEQERGIEYLQDAQDFFVVDNFPFYYKRLKKFNCLRDLKKMGYNVSRIYCEDLTNPKAKEINDLFETYDVHDIFQLIKKPMMELEASYSVGDASETANATSGIEELLVDLQVRPEVGARLQGDIFNTVCRGARRTKYYIRSMSSGVGKTRSAVGDACLLAYPLRFNTLTWRWEMCGASEKTLFIATEQEIDEIQTLILAYLTGFNEEKFLYNEFNDEERKIVDQAVKVMKHYADNLFIVCMSNPNIEQIKAVVRQNWILHDIKNVFYDYIFSSPSLLNEFRDLRIREDVALGMLSTALKDLAVEMKLFIMSATQTNAKSEEDRSMKNESVVRGARSIIDKCDIACVVSRVTSEEEELLVNLTEKTGIIPNQVTDVYKVRRGRYTNVKIWSFVDLGTCRKHDLFITDEKLNEIQNFHTIKFMFDEHNTEELKAILDELRVETEDSKPVIIEEQPKNTIEQIDKQEAKKKGMFGDLL